MQSESARRVGEPSGQGEDPSSERLGGHYLLAQAEPRRPASQVVGHHLGGEPGGAHFLRETVGRVRYAGARGQLTVRADSGFYTHAAVAVCRKLDVRFSITIRQHKSLDNLIEAIPEDAWTPVPYRVDGAADVAETTYRGRLRSPGESLYTMLRLGIVRIRYGMLLLQSIYSQ